MSSEVPIHERPAWNPDDGGIHTGNGPQEWVKRLAATIERETPSSVEIGLNAKGDPTYQIKVYCEAGQEMAAAFTALNVEVELRYQLGLPQRSEVPGGPDDRAEARE